MNVIFKKLSFKLLNLFGLLLLIILIFYFIGFFKMKFQFEKDQKQLNNKHIFIGDSHIQKSIEASKLPQSINIAQVSESFYYSFYKLKYLKDNNVSIKSVNLGVGYHSFSEFYDNFTFGLNSEDIRARYFYILPFMENFSYNLHHITSILNFSKSIISKNANSVTEKDDLQHTFLGGYSNSFVNNKVDSLYIQKRIEDQFYKGGKSLNISKINSSYFDSIVTFSRKNKIKLTLIFTPVHPMYEKQVPVHFKKYFTQKCKRSGCNLIVFDSIHFFNDCFYLDGDHVTKKGADKITSAINSMSLIGLNK